MIDFSGWSMPVQYEGIMAEHRVIREGCGMFDVSHMGRIRIDGTDSAQFLNMLLTNEVMSIKPGGARYSLLCREDGGIIDDMVIFRLGVNEYLAIPNAGSYEKVLNWFNEWKIGFQDVTLHPLRDETAMIAVQGPRSEEIMGRVSNLDLSALRRFSHSRFSISGHDVLVARTGYTGEDGFEVISKAEHAVAIWEALMGEGCIPCGLGSRDTLRLEAGLLLYGSDMDESINPLEVGLKTFVSLSKDFIGASALRAQEATGVQRRLYGLTIDKKLGVPRAHQDVYSGEKLIGRTTSGTFSPSLGVGIALALLSSDLEVGAMVNVDIRGKRVPSTLSSLPFYIKRD
jgi:aminomethyltransferase